MSTTTESRRKTNWLVPVIVIVLALGLIAFVVIDSEDAETTEPAAPDSSATQGADPSAPEEAPEEDFSYAEFRDEGDLLAAGPVDAPVGLVVFSDYQCPFCAQWNQETLPVMMEQADAGHLRIEWRDINVFGEASTRAAHASYAAAKQDMYWEYHDALFEGGDILSEGELSEEALIELAGELGLDTEQFAQDLNADDTAAAIQAHEDLGMALGAMSTPVFLLGGKPIAGAQPTEVFVDAFNEALEAEQ